MNSSTYWNSSRV